MKIKLEKNNYEKDMYFLKFDDGSIHTVVSIHRKDLEEICGLINKV